MRTAENIAVAAIVALARCKAATCMRAGGSRLDRQVAKLSYLLGHNHKVDPKILRDFRHEGLIRWDNGNVITDTGDALLGEIIKLRAGV